MARPGLVLLAGPVLAATALLPWQAGWLCAVAAIIVLGVPHGALDAEIARPLLRPRLGKLWFPVFSLPYLLLAGCVLVAWRLAPLATLAGFLAASAWHFGREDAPQGSVTAVLARGGLTIAAPLLFHPAATVLVLGVIAQAPLATPPAWLWAAALGWLLLAAYWAVAAAWRRDWPSLTPALLLACGFWLLPPLIAFAIYFVCIHAPAHTQALIGNRHLAPRVHDSRSAVLLALPVTVLTILIGLSLWPLYAGDVPTRLLALTIQLLAALTLPHMLLNGWMARRAAFSQASAS